MAKSKKTQDEYGSYSDSGFASPNRIKNQRPADKPKDGEGITWDYRCPQYDQRSSCFVNAGTHYGVGINQPIGHTGKTKQSVDVLPYGRVNTMRVTEE